MKLICARELFEKTIKMLNQFQYMNKSADI